MPRGTVCLCHYELVAAGVLIWTCFMYIMCLHNLPDISRCCATPTTCSAMQVVVWVPKGPPRTRVDESPPPTTGGDGASGSTDLPSTDGRDDAVGTESVTGDRKGSSPYCHFVDVVQRTAWLPTPLFKEVRTVRVPVQYTWYTTRRPFLLQSTTASWARHPHYR